MDYKYSPTGELLSYLYSDSAGEVNAEYAYDYLHQLTQENEHTYGYDSFQNRIYKDHVAQNINKLAQVTDDGQLSYRYDENGNMVQAGDLELEYDGLDRLIAVHAPNETYHYSYDSFNRRIAKQTPSKSIKYLWQGQNEIGSSEGELRILGEGLGAEIGSAVFIQLNNRLYTPLHDQRGAVVALIDMDGCNAETMRYTAFGEEMTESALSPWRFCSKRLDEETGFLYFGRRYYAPSLGRWVTADPKGFVDGPNLYAYIHNSPLLAFDLYGEYSLLTGIGNFGLNFADFAFPATSAFFRLPSDTPFWQKGMYAALSGFEIVTTFMPPARAGFSAAVRPALYATNRVAAHYGEMQLVRSAEKKLLPIADKKLVNRSINDATTFKTGSNLSSKTTKNGMPCLDKLS